MIIKWKKEQIFWRFTVKPLLWLLKDGIECIRGHNIKILRENNKIFCKVHAVYSPSVVKDMTY